MRPQRQVGEGFSGVSDDEPDQKVSQASPAPVAVREWAFRKESSG
jgi:hypothetical protein